MFDALTLAQLYALHTSLAHQHTSIHARLIDPITRLPLLDPLSPDWDLLGTKEEDIGETMRAIYAEINRREQARADA